MTKEDLFCLAKDFNEWIENMSEKYNYNKNEIQYLIKQLLI
jgi:hypothetical protein